MKTDYTYKDLQSMSVRELRTVLGEMNKEARKRAGRLKASGYTGAMTSPVLMPVRGLKKAELQEAILDRSQAYLRNPRSTLKGMRNFEKKLRESIAKETGLNIKRSELDDFIEYINMIKEVWGSLRYPSRNAVQLYEEMQKAKISGRELRENFEAYLKTSQKGKSKTASLEGKLLNIKEELEDANRTGQRVTANDVRAKLGLKRKK